MNIVDLERDYPGKIDDFSVARNSFLEKLPDKEYILWKSRDEELTQSLLNFLPALVPRYPYYAVRRINIWNGKFSARHNPDLSPHLVSNKVRYVGRVHETVVPRKPFGIIDYPIIHFKDSSSKWAYSSGWKEKSAYIPVIAVKKALHIIRYGDG